MRAKWTSVYVAACCKGDLYQWGQGSWSRPGGNSRHNQEWTGRQEAAAAELEVSAGDLLTRGLRDLFNSSPPVSHTRRARTHVQKQSTQVCTHALTHGMGVGGGEERRKKKENNRHTQTHHQATAEWSQLERHRHFDLSTARISGRVRTTHA